MSDYVFTDEELAEIRERQSWSRGLPLGSAADEKPSEGDLLYPKRVIHNYVFRGGSWRATAQSMAVIEANIVLGKAGRDKP